MPVCPLSVANTLNLNCNISAAWKKILIKSYLEHAFDWRTMTWQYKTNPLWFGCNHTWLPYAIILYRAVFVKLLYIKDFTQVLNWVQTRGRSHGFSWNTGSISFVTANYVGSYRLNLRECVWLTNRLHFVESSGKRTDKWEWLKKRERENVATKVLFLMGSLSEVRGLCM